jgi:hypothetical protein
MDDLNTKLDYLLKNFNDINSKLNQLEGTLVNQNTRIDELSKEIENLTKQTDKVCEQYKNGLIQHKDFLINYAVEVILQKIDEIDFMKKYMKLILTDDQKQHFDAYMSNKVTDRNKQWWSKRIIEEINKIKNSYKKYKDCELFKQDIILKLCSIDSKWTEDSINFIKNNIILLRYDIIPKNIEGVNSEEYIKILNEKMDPLFFVTDTEIGEFIVPESRLRTRDTLEINPSIFDKELPVKTKKQRISDGYRKSSKRRSTKRRSSKCKSTKRRSNKRRSRKHRSSN